jgi:hypothetical protein
MIDPEGGHSLYSYGTGDGNYGLLTSFFVAGTPVPESDLTFATGTHAGGFVLLGIGFSQVQLIYTDANDQTIFQDGDTFVFNVNLLPDGQTETINGSFSSSLTVTNITSAVPEPGTWTLFGFGMIGFTALFWRRFSQQR